MLLIVNDSTFYLILSKSVPGRLQVIAKVPKFTRMSCKLIISMLINEPPHGKTNNLHRRKQRRSNCEADLRLCFADWIV